MPQRAGKLLVTLGGSDPKNVTGQVLKAIESLERSDLEVRVVLGPSSPHINALEQQSHRMQGEVRILTAVSDMPRLMAWSDLALAAAGTTSWELAFMGLPSLLIVTASNQAPTARELGSLGAVRSLSSEQSPLAESIAAPLRQLLSAPLLRSRMSHVARDLVDGYGASRVLMRLTEDPFRLRQVQAGDEELLWTWANDPEVRRQSFTPETIPRTAHAEWFRRKIEDEECLLLLAFDHEDNPLGQARFDIDEHGSANIDVSIAKEHRGHGYGTSLISLASREVLRLGMAKKLNAFVKSDNTASLLAFQRAGFHISESRVEKGSNAYNLVYQGTS